MTRIFSALVFFAVSFPALAYDDPMPVSEPGSLALVGIAAAAAIFVLRRKK